MEYRIITTDELYHHGVKGQKWGTRRYQNPDGSYKSGAEGRYDGDSTGRKHTKSSDKSKSSSEKKGLSDNAKRNIKIAAAVVGTAAVAAGTAYAVKKLNVKATDLLKEQDKAKAHEYFQKAINKNQKASDLINAADRLKTGKYTKDDLYKVGEALDASGYYKNGSGMNTVDRIRLGKATTSEKAGVVSASKYLSESLDRVASIERMDAIRFQDRASKGNYSTKEKINALKNNTKKAVRLRNSMAGVGTVQVNRTSLKRTPVGFSNYSMSDLKKLDLY